LDAKGCRIWATTPLMTGFEFERAFKASRVAFLRWSLEQGREARKIQADRVVMPRGARLTRCQRELTRVTEP
jgi:hypothetical protein